MTRARKIGIGCGSVLAIVAIVLAGGFYRLTRPDPRFVGAVSIEHDATYQDPALLERAWALPVARLYRDHFDSQHNGSFCGPTSVVDVVRSLPECSAEPEPTRLCRPAALGQAEGGMLDQDHVLDGTDIRTVFGFLPGGLTIEQVATLMSTRLPGHHVMVHRDLDLESLRALLRQSNDVGRREIANFHRGPLFARGVGHHSPIGGYLEDEDLVFVLDVNHDYRPWLAPAPRLLEAMNVIDPASGDTRGIVVIE